MCLSRLGNVAYTVDCLHFWKLKVVTIGTIGTNGITTLNARIIAIGYIVCKERNEELAIKLV